MDDGVFRLENCSLRPLGDGEARSLGERLATVEPWRTLGSTVENLVEYLSRTDPALERKAVEAGGELAGVVCVRHPWLRGPFVELLALLAGRRRRGLGRQLMAWVENRPEWARRNVWTTVSAFNAGARAFYARCGYQEVARLPGLVSTGHDEILLRRVLDRERGRL